MTAIIVMMLNLYLSAQSVHDFTMTSIDGEKVALAQFKGKKILLVNTASNCGFTKQYKELQELQDRYKDDLVVIGFPANNFGNQEPGSNEDIQAFCERNYGVTFLLSEKVNVKGEGMAPLFHYLTSQENPDFKGEIKWNFEKFLIDENGKLMHRYRSAVTPLDKTITDNI